MGPSRSSETTRMVAKCQEGTREGLSGDVFESSVGRQSDAKTLRRKQVSRNKKETSEARRRDGECSGNKVGKSSVVQP